MKIAVRICNWIGDVVMSLPAMEALRRHYPQAEITAIARPWVIEVLTFRPDLVDRTIAIRDQSGLQAPLAIWRSSREIKLEKFDLSVVFTKHFKGAFLSYLAAIPQRIGFSNLETRWFLNHGLDSRSLPKSGRHQSLDYLDLLEKGAGLAVDHGLVPRLDKQSQISALVRDKFLEGATYPILVLHAGAAFGTAKRWLPERYAQVCRRFLETSGGTVALLGVSSEREVNTKIEAMVQSADLRNLCGKTSLRESLALISECDGFLSNDSGLMHAAAAFAKPQVAIFGPTDAKATFPHNRQAALFRKPVPCSPCFMRHCPIGHDCMVGVETDEVWAAVQSMFKSGLKTT